MTIDTWLTAAQHQLAATDVPTARLDALILLEDCLQRDRALLLAHPETKLTETQLAQLTEQLQRRAAHEPLAYIRGHSEFYGREFYVDQHVLEPRPESETIIDQLLRLAAASPATGLIVDIGTGSGALVITAACELHANGRFQVVGTDIDPACLEVAKRNAKRHQADVRFLAGNLLEPLLNTTITSSAPIFALLCNLPYVPDEYPVNRAANHEPRLALYGGVDGLDLYRTLFAQLDDLSRQPRYIITETLPEQHSELTKIATAHGYVLMQRDDFIQVFHPS